ncbi:hypothetical protein KC354_g144 [Hortaea werneckii]|nr:hypothetical protein KC354_g144 [Hortaea werneckii]
MRQEIVTDEETHKDPVIQRTLQVKSERLIRHAHLDGKVFSEDADVQPDERLRRLLYTFLLLWRTTALVCNMSWLIALAAVAWFGVVGEYILTEDPEMSIVRFYIWKALTQYRRLCARRSMKGVPGVMELESQVFLGFSGSSPPPFSVMAPLASISR